ncbi:MAG TPA: hypothetical protein VHK01_02710 [Lacipirellulaceae bacterium]|jgi:hypothetical protein|nr:hypothetical protein [Lacipirellulaceae bacterium]
MNEAFSRFVEQIITRVPRRQFLAQLGRGALVAVCLLGSLLAFATVTVAHRDKATGNKCCLYECTRVDGSTYGQARTAPCKNEFVNADGDRCVLIARYDCDGR